MKEILTSGIFKIAHREQSLPLSYVDEKGKPSGFAVEICEKFSDHLKNLSKNPQFKSEYITVSTKNRIEKIEMEEVDVECGSTTNTNERRQRVAFTVPHYVTGARLLVRSDSGITELGSKNIHKVGSTINTTPLRRLEELKKVNGWTFDIVTLKDHEEAIQALENRMIDGFVMDEILLSGLKAKSTLSLAIVGKSLTIEPLAIMMSKKSPELKKELDQFMKKLIISNEIYPIYDKWFQKPIPLVPAGMGLKLNYLTRDMWRYPSDYVP